MKRVLLDANIFLHALGSDAVLRPACQSIIDQLAEGRLLGEVSSLILSEVVHVRHRRSGDRQRAVQDGLAAAALVVVRPVLDLDFVAALDIFLAHDSLQMSDAVHVAVGRRHGLTAMLSTDRGLDGVAGLHRVDPADGPAVAALVGN